MYRKQILFTFFILFTSIFASAQLNTGIDAVVGKVQLFFNKSQYDSIYSMLSARSQGIMTADKLKNGMAGLHAQAGDLQTIEPAKTKDQIAYYKATFKNVTLTMITSIDADNKIEKFSFVPYKDESVPTEKSNYILTTPTGKIYGTLTMPQTKGKVPVVLLIAGSGPTDRDGNSFLGVKSNTYKMIADSLKQAGIACVRYDKRGMGESAGAMTRQEDVDFSAYINDASGFAEMLKKDTLFSTVIVAGHSEGSLIGMIVANRQHVNKYISISGAGEPIYKTLLDQLKANSMDITVAQKIIDSLKKDMDVKYVPENMNMYFMPSLQPFLRSLFKYDPLVEIKKLKMPILLLQGDNDFQVYKKNADYLQKAAPKAKLVIIKKMNHVLKDAPTDREGNFATYGNPDLALSAGLTMAMIKFIKE